MRLAEKLDWKELKLYLLMLDAGKCIAEVTNHK
jgi:hypothetical protein